MEAALFQDLGNSPTTFDAFRWADYYGCLPGNDVQMADAIQAYIQAKLSGIPCWVELPDEAWRSTQSSATSSKLEAGDVSYGRPFHLMNHNASRSSILYK